MNRILLFSLLLLAPLAAAAQQDTTRQVTLDEVSVSTARQGMLQNRTSLGQLETINRTGLQQMACCTLSASFENTATTQTSYSDAVTGTRQIQMLGLSGLYTQTMAENVPTLRGLAYTFGWDYTPSAWLEGISISKGAGTVVNGYEGITGQINLDYQKPNTGQPLYVDLYTDTELHNEVNAIAKHAFSPKLFTGLFLHTTQTAMPDRWHSRMDANHDLFMDMPKVHNYHLYNRWLYVADRVQSRLDVRLVFDQRRAGQMNQAHAYGTHPTAAAETEYQPVGLPTRYEVGTRNLNFQASNKTGFSIGTRDGQSLGIINSVTLHGLRTHYGLKTLDADQKTYYGNLIFNSHLGTNHRYQLGASYQFDYTTTHFSHLVPGLYEHPELAWDSSYSILSGIDMQQKVSDYGLFAEYTNTQWAHLTLQAGLRADYLLHRGWLATPRLNVKYAPAEWLVARLSAGRGYRVANPLVENLGLMASSRQVTMLPIGYDNDLERAWNIGGNLIFTIPIWNRQQATLSVDYYHVRFSNHIVANLDASEMLAIMAPSRDHNHTDTWQADLSLPLAKGLTLYAAWRYTLQRVGQMASVLSEGTSARAVGLIDGKTYATSQPLVPAYKALAHVEYATAMRRWVFNTTLQLNGRTRLPGHYDVTRGAVEADHSPAYALLFAQVARRFRNVEVYLGGENLLSYKQQNPIIGWDEPFSSHFDASQVWAPITGAKCYAGLRLNIGRYL